MIIFSRPGVHVQVMINKIIPLVVCVLNTMAVLDAHNFVEDALRVLGAEVVDSSEVSLSEEVDESFVAVDLALDVYFQCLNFLEIAGCWVWSCE